MLLDLEVAVLLANRRDKRIYQQLPKFPAVTRDLALLVSQDILVADLTAAITSSAGKLLESADLFDVYSGRQVPDGQKSIAFSLVFRSPEKTLSDEDIAPAMKRILRQLGEQFGAQLRE